MNWVELTLNIPLKLNNALCMVHFRKGKGKVESVCQAKTEKGVLSGVLNGVIGIVCGNTSLL